MKKFAVFSGFLGSGKTTAMIALTRYYSTHHGKAAMISNDLGEGVTLADHRLAVLSGVKASEITDECICFCHDVLTDRLKACYDEGCELVLSDIPGFGVGALEHVYHGLTAEYPGQFDLAPFTVLIEPQKVERLKRDSSEEERAGTVYDDAVFILRAQLSEADLIVLNKCDLLTDEEVSAYGIWLSEAFPQAEVIPISAKTGAGLEALSAALEAGSASLRHPDIDYEDENLQNAMDCLSEYYLQYHAEVCCNDFNGTEYLADMARKAQEVLKDGSFEVPHLKLLAWDATGDFGKVDLLGIDRPVEITRRFRHPCTGIAVILNASAACPADVLDRVLMNAVTDVSARYQLELLIHRREFFSLGE